MLNDAGVRLLEYNTKEHGIDNEVRHYNSKIIPIVLDLAIPEVY